MNHTSIGSVVKYCFLGVFAALSTVHLAHGQTAQDVNAKDIQNTAHGVHAFMDIRVTSGGVTKPLHEVATLKTGDTIVACNVKGKLKSNIVYVDAGTGTVGAEDFKWGTRGHNGECMSETIMLGAGMRAFLLVTPWDGPDRSTIQHTVAASAQPLLDLRDERIAAADIQTGKVLSLVAEIATSTADKKSSQERSASLAKDVGLTLPTSCFDKSNDVKTSSASSAGSAKPAEAIKKNDPKDSRVQIANCVFTDLSQQGIKKNIEDAKKQKQGTTPPSGRKLLVDGASIGVEVLRTLPYGGLVVAGMQGFVFFSSMKRDQSYEYVSATPIKVGEFTGFAHQGAYKYGKSPFSVLVYPLTAHLEIPGK